MKPRLLALLLLAATLTGCATKRDLRDLRNEMQEMQASQEALVREMQRQSERQLAAVLDTLATRDVRLRGDLTNQMVQIERQLIQVQELTGQGQQGLAELRETIREREEAIRAMQAAATAAPPAAGNPDELFSSARNALERGSFATARAGFEEFVRSFPQEPRAAEAQLLVGASYEEAEDVPRALESYARVLELFPSAPQSATALYRAALLELDADNEDRARAMLNQITTAYPESPEARLAREQLRKLR